MKKISVIIPTRNRANQLAIALKSLAGVKFPKKDFEVIVVDNGSTDQTADVARLEAALPQAAPIRYVYEPVPGLLAGRHRGFFEAEAPLLAFLDDDVQVSEQWLDAVVESFRPGNVHLVGGPSFPKYEVEPPPWLAYLWQRNKDTALCGFLSLLDLGRVPKEIDATQVWGLNLSIRKATLQDVGGFNPDCMPRALERYQGDGETGLSLKLCNAGIKGFYHPQAAVSHLISRERLTLPAVDSRQRYQAICDSYTKLRGSEAPRKNFMRPLSLVKRMIRGTLGSAVHRSSGGGAKKSADRVAFEDRCKSSYRQGYDYHQREASQSPSLMEWIKRTDYFNYSLPDEVGCQSQTSALL
jgi:glycosyltransferase involved in cell wall biosynthesis